MFTPAGIINFLEVAAQLGIIATAAALLMIGGEFDLSIGSMIGLAGILIAIPAVEYGWPLWAAILMAFACAGLVGWINGNLVNKRGYRHLSLPWASCSFCVAWLSVLAGY